MNCTCILFLFNTDVNWLPASLAPMVIPGSQYSLIITFNIFFVVILFLSKSEYK